MYKSLIEEMNNLADKSDDESYRHGVHDAIDLVMKEKIDECEKEIERLKVDAYMSKLQQISKCKQPFCDLVRVPFI